MNAALRLCVSISSGIKWKMYDKWFALVNEGRRENLTLNPLEAFASEKKSTSYLLADLGWNNDKIQPSDAFNHLRWLSKAIRRQFRYSLRHKWSLASSLPPFHDLFHRFTREKWLFKAKNKKKLIENPCCPRKQIQKVIILPLNAPHVDSSHHHHRTLITSSVAYADSEIGWRRNVYVR